MRIKTGLILMKLLVLFLLGIPSAAPALHSLKYFSTGSAQVPNFPEFVTVGLVDEDVVEHYDSNTRRFAPKQDWINKVREDDPTYWEKESHVALVSQETFKAHIEILKRRFNQTGGVHVVQRMYGCEWDDETDEVNGFDQFGFDGEDFLALDLKTETYIAPVPQAVITKHKWDNDKAELAYLKNYYTKECPDWLKKYVNLGKNSLMRKELPSRVSLLQKTPSSPVTCHATGFYPDSADLFWKKDEEELHEDVDRGEILPNHDGTFQMSIDLDLSSVQAADWGRYSCVFHLAGGKEDVVTTLDKRQILTNRDRPGSPSEPSAGVIGGVIGGVAALLVVVAGIIGFVVWRKKERGYKATSGSDTSSSSGEDPAVKKRTGEEQSMLKQSA